jgi:hypothetical protein
MNRTQKIHLIISAVMWGLIVTMLIVVDGLTSPAFFFMIVGMIFNVLCISVEEYIFEVLLLVILITFGLGLVATNRNLDTQAKAVELYEQGRYEESMDEFMKIKDTGFVDEYVEKYEVYELKGTDIKVRVEE